MIEMNEKEQSFETKLKDIYDAIKDELKPSFLNQHATIYMLIDKIGSQEKNQKKPKNFLGGVLYHVGSYFLGKERWRLTDIMALLGMTEATLRKYVKYIEKNHGSLFRPPIYKSK